MLAFHPASLRFQYFNIKQTNPTNNGDYTANIDERIVKPIPFESERTFQ